MVLTREFRLVNCLVLLHFSLISAFGQNDAGLAEHARMADTDVPESSGIAMSRRFEDIFWTHNDDGPPSLSAVGLDGRLVRSYQLPVRNNDWEDIALDAANKLYLLDNTSRDDDQYRMLIHVLAEPNPFHDDEVASVDTFEIRYREDSHDTEALFVWEDKVFIVTKPWDGSWPRIYEAENGKDSQAVLIGELSNKAMITGGDLSADGKMVALSSYRALFIFEGDDPEEALMNDPLVCPLNAGQIEGISWRGRDLILSNERGSIFWVTEADWRGQEAPRERYPTISVPQYVPPALQRGSPEEWERGTWLESAELGRMGRIAWSEEGLYIGIHLPEGLEMPSLEEGEGEDFDHWFLPGRVYVLMNPRGDRRLDYGSNDRCIVLGADEEGTLSCESRQLLPATYIQNRKNSPDWVIIERTGRWIVATITSEGPGLDQLKAEKRMGFNLVIIGEQGRTLSWAPLTLEFSWDAPSFWGIIELFD